MTAAQRISTLLHQVGVTHVFGVPGETGLGIAEAIVMHPDIQYVTTRHEEGAGIMACAFAKLSKSVGVFAVSRGPGLAHALVALHVAKQDSLPVLLIVGQVNVELRGKEAFQEVDVVSASLPWAKWAIEAESGEAAVSAIRSALAFASEGRPGPVVVSIPNGIEYERTGDTKAPAQRPDENIPTIPNSVGVALSEARRPVVIAGELIAQSSNQAVVVGLVEKLGAAVYTSWRNPDAFPNGHPNYLGTLPWLPKPLLHALRGSDIILAIGSRFDQLTSLGYELPSEGQKVLLAHPDADEIARTNNVTAIVGEIGSICRALTKVASGFQAGSTTWIQTARTEWISQTTPPVPDPDSMISDPASLFDSLRRVLPPDSITTCDAGAFAGLVHRYLRWNAPGSFLGTMAGSMGFAVPAAVGARISEPARPVVAFAGDGGFLMTHSELATASSMDIGRLVCIVFDDSGYGAIRRHLRLAEADPLTRLAEIDFATLGRSIGAHGVAPRTYGEFESEVLAGLDAPWPTVVHIRIDGPVEAWPPALPYEKDIE